MRPAQHLNTDWSGDWKALTGLIPYLLEFKGRVVGAMLFLILAKVANVGVPIVLKHIVDRLDSTTAQLVSVPLALLLAYGGLRFATALFGELRDAVFARVAERAMRRVGLEVFEHLHRMELDFHLSRRTGGLSRDIERGTNGISFLLRFMLFNILPTLFEIALVAGILLVTYDVRFAVIIFVAVIVYVAFSVLVTEWRMKFIREANEMDSRSNTHAIDSLLNFETVKYFANEKYEAEQYDKNLAQWETARMKNRLSLVTLNSGQGLIIAASITLMMIMAANRVVAGSMTLGDLVLINAYMIQLFIPLNFLGFVYREIKNALANIERMLELLKKTPGIADKPGAGPLQPDGGAIKFEHVSFGYKPERRILHDVSFEIPAGHKIAIVGPSGAGKSTIARLLFRFYDIDEGAITVNGQDIRDVTQESLRKAIGVVPQDTVLFNDTLHYNILYGCPDAAEDEIRRAARLAHLERFIEQLPDGYDTLVGERGLKLSGGEKQRVAIARTLLKNPCIMIFDEATSSLDSTSEKAILQAFNEVAENRTTLAIAHRLSTIVDADNIIVLDHGRVVEQGTHHELLKHNGVYAQLWKHQKQESQKNLTTEGTENTERLKEDLNQKN
ncbi:MAG TPA: ABC transporter ATP-binding protein/permease [Gammaproteobacteria bacterium]